MLNQGIPHHLFKAQTFHKNFECVYYNAQNIRFFSGTLKGTIFGLQGENKESWKLQQLCYMEALSHITM
jgi:hypothetical protein